MLKKFKGKRKLFGIIIFSFLLILSTFSYFILVSANPDITVVQSKIESGDYTISHAISFASSVTEGSLIVVAISSQGGDVSGISDNQGNSYTLIQNGDNALDLYGRMYYANNSASGATTITVTYADYYDSIISIYEISGMDITAPLDVSAENEESGYLNSHTSGTTASTNQANEIVIAMYIGDSNYDVYTATGYTLIDKNASDLYSSLASGYKIISSTGTQSATFSSANAPDTYMQGYGAIATFKEVIVAATNYSLIITSPKTASPVSVSSGDNISIDFDFQEDGVNITSGVTLDNITIGGIEANIVTSGGGGSPVSNSEDFTPSTDYATYQGQNSGWYAATSSTLCTNDANDNCVCYDEDTANGLDNISKQTSVDLSGCALGTANLTIGKLENAGTLEATDCIKVRLSNDSGSTWSALNNVGCDDLAFLGNSQTLEIPDDYLTSGFRMMFQGNQDATGGSAESMCMDDIVIACSAATASDEFAYISGIGWQVNVTVPTFESGLKDLFINATYDAVSLGTSSGFVTTAPTADPTGDSTKWIDFYTVTTKDTSPADALGIVEVGVYLNTIDTFSESMSFGLYNDTAGVPDGLLYSVTGINTTSTPGWITATVDWAIDGSTAYWLGVNTPAVTGDIVMDRQTSGGSGLDSKSGSGLPNPYAGGSVEDADGQGAIYALLDAGSGNVRNDTETNAVDYGSADSEPPNVTINSPSNTTYSTTTINFNVTSLDDTGMGECQFSLNSGTLNYTMSNLTTTHWNATNYSMTQGSHTVTFFCNDTTDNINGTESQTFYIDSIGPIMEIPPAVALEFNEPLYADFNATDSGIGVGNFSINWSSDFSITIAGVLTNSSLLAVGNYYINVSVNDTLGNLNSTIYNVNVSAIAPNITIISPISKQVFKQDSPTAYLNVTTNVNSSLCYWNDGTSNFSMTGLNSTYFYTSAGATLGDGNHTVSFWCNDSSGGLWGHSDDVSFFVDSINVTECRPLTVASRDYLLLNGVYSSDTSAACFNVYNESIDFDLGNNNVTGPKSGSTHGIAIVSSANVTIHDGKIYNFDNGIYAPASASNNFTNINITNSSTHGIVLIGAASNNIFKDSKLGDVSLSSGSTNNIFINSSYGTEAVITGSSLIRKWYLDVQVNDTLGSPIESAKVDISLSNSSIISSESTNVSGRITQNELVSYRNNAGSKTYWSNYTVNVSKNGYQNLTVQYNITGNNIYNATLLTNTPQIVLVYPTNTTYTSVQTELNFSYVNSSIDSCWYSTDGGSTNITHTTCANVTGLTSNEGSNIWLIGINDTTGNSNYSTVQFFVDSLLPKIISPPAQDLEYIDEPLYADFNATETNPDVWTINWTSNFTIDSSTGVLTNTTLLLTGEYYINITFNDTYGNTNSTIYNVNVSDTTLPYFTTIPADEEIDYPEDWAGVDFDATDDGVGFSSYAINWTSLFTINSSGFLDAGILAAGEYYINVTINDSSNNKDSLIYNLNVTKNSTYVLNITGTSPITYGTLSDVVGSGCPVQLSCSMNFGDNIYGVVTSPLTFNYSTSGNENYSANSVTFDLTINKATPVGTLDGNTSIVYGTAGDVYSTSGASGDDGCVYGLFRNNISVSDPDTTVLGAGTYDYLLNTTGCDNYSSSASMDTFSLTVNQSTSDCDVLFNETSPLNYTQNFKAYSNCDSAFTLYRNSTVITNNSQQALGVGTYNFTVIRTDNANYTNITDTEYFTINQAIGEVYLYLNNSRENITIESPTTIDINATLNVGEGNIELYNNGTLFNNGTTVYNSTTFTTPGIYNITAIYLWNENYTQDSETWWVTVGDTTGPTCVLISRTPSDILDNSTGVLSFILNCSDPNGINVTKIGDEYQAAFVTRTVDAFTLAAGVPNYWSVRYPNNSLGVTGELSSPFEIWRALGRNEGKWFDDLTGSGLSDCTGLSPCYAPINDTFSYSIEDGGYGRLNIINESTTNVIINFTHPVVSVGAFRQVIYLDWGDMVHEVKKNSTILKGTPILVKGFDPEAYRNTANYTANLFLDIGVANSPSKPLQIYYCNSSYNPAGSTRPDLSINCDLANTLDYTAINSKLFTEGNSSYIQGTFSITNGVYAGIKTTAEYYLEFRTDNTAVSKEYLLKYVNGSTTGVGFNETNTVWKSSNAGVTWSQQEYTIDLFTTFVKDVNDEFQFGYYLTDLEGNSGYNFTFIQDAITPTNHPISNPFIFEYNSTGTLNDFDKNSTHKGIMNVLVHPAKDPDSVGNVTHNLSLMNLDGTFNYTINESFKAPSDLDIWIDFNTSLVPDGNYRTKVIATSGDNSLDVRSYITIDNFTIDNTAPNIQIVYPPADYYNTSNFALDVNYTYSDTNVDSCWWTDDEGGTNYSLGACAYNLTGPWVQGLNNVTIYINDTSGNENSSTIHFTVDYTGPGITSPDNQSLEYLDDALYADFNATDSGIGVGTFGINWTVNFTINASTGILINSSILPLGQFYINVSVNDTLGNLNSILYNVNVSDTTYPVFTDFDNQSIYNNQSLSYDINATDFLFDSFKLNNWTSVFSINLVTGVLTNSSPMSIKEYYVNVSINDTSGNIATDLLLINVSAFETTPPHVVIYSPLNQSYPTITTLFNISAMNGAAVDTCLYSLNGGTLNRSMTQSGYYWTDTNSSMTQGSHTVNFYCNDTNGNQNNTESQIFYIDTLGPILISPPAQSLIYGDTPLYADFNATDSGIGVGTFGINWTVNFTINASTGILTNTTILPIGRFYINVSVNDTLGNTNSTIYNVNVTDITSPKFTYIPTDEEILYNTDWVGVDFNATDDNGLDTFLVNDTKFTIIADGFLDTNSTILAVGNYYVNVSIRDLSNNLNSTIYNLNITKITPNITIEWTNNIYYGTPSDAEGLEYSDGDSDVTYNLYREGTPGSGVFIPVSNPDTTILGAGMYDYRLVVSGGENYSAGNLTMGSLSVLQANSSTNLTLNGTSSNLVINENVSIYLNCSTLVGEGAYLSLYRNGTLINNGTSPISNLTNFTVVAIENITCFYQETQNYTVSSQTYFVTVGAADILPPNVTIYTPNDTLVSNGNRSITINYSIVDDTGVSSCYYSLYDSSGNIHNSLENDTIICGSYFTITPTYWGPFTLQLWGEDAVGNAADANLTFTTVFDSSTSGGGGSGYVVYGGKLNMSLEPHYYKNGMEILPENLENNSYNGISFDIVGDNKKSYPINVTVLNVYPRAFREAILNQTVKIGSNDKKILFTSDIIKLNRLSPNTTFFVSFYVKEGLSVNYANATYDFVYEKPETEDFLFNLGERIWEGRPWLGLLVLVVALIGLLLYLNKLSKKKKKKNEKRN